MAAKKNCKVQKTIVSNGKTYRKKDTGTKAQMTKKRKELNQSGFNARVVKNQCGKGYVLYKGEKR